MRKFIHLRNKTKSVANKIEETNKTIPIHQANKTMTQNRGHTLLSSTSAQLDCMMRHDPETIRAPTERQTKFDVNNKTLT